MSIVEFPINLYCSVPPSHVEMLDLSRGNEDFRRVYIVTDADRKFVIKYCSNAFTDAERITGWNRLANAYNLLGIYCPTFIKTSSGELFYHYYEKQRAYYVYAEEFAKFDTAEHIGRERLKDEKGQAIYLPDLMRSIGKVANAHLDFCDWSSQFCILEPHTSSDEFIDEITRAAARLTECVKNNFPEFQDRMEHILDLFYEHQNQLKTIYSQLPTSCFQGDLNDTNILINQDNQFAGVIDFNVCGREPILNYAIREALMHIEDTVLFDEEGNELYFYDEKLDAVRMDSFMKNMTYIGEIYKFNDREQCVFPMLFRYINSFWWEQVYAIKQNVNDIKKVEKILDWIEFQLIRDDIALPSCALGKNVLH